VATAKKEYTEKERSEMNAHIEARNLKEAAPFIEGPTAQCEAAESASKAVVKAGAPMASLSGEELQAFSTPATVSEAVEKAVAAANEKITEAKEAVKEKLKEASEVNPQTGGSAEAKKQLNALQKMLEDAAKSSSKTLAQVKAKCTSLVQPKFEAVGTAIRKHAQSQKQSAEELFDSLKQEDKIPEDAFCKLVSSLEGIEINAEVAKLVFRKIGAEGITKEAFSDYVVLYYKVVKTIAFTDVLDITKCKTMRKADVGEILELIEGPVTDEENGITRIRAKSTKDPPASGWVTLAGNQGGVFLELKKKA